MQTLAYCLLLVYTLVNMSDANERLEAELAGLLEEESTLEELSASAQDLLNQYNGSGQLPSTQTLRDEVDRISSEVAAKEAAIAMKKQRLTAAEESIKYATNHAHLVTMVRPDQQA